MRSLRSKIALILAASALATLAQAESAKPGWADYHSTVTDVDVDVKDSFNRKKETDNSIDRSFNTDVTKNVEVTKKTDNSVEDSFNTGIETHYTRQTGRSVHDSYNTTDVDTTKIDLRLDTQTVTPTVNTSKYVATLDTQDANNGASMVGPTQYAAQGGFYMGSVGEESSSPGYYAAGRGAEIDVSEYRKLSQANSAVVHGPNLGAISNVNVANQGRDLVFGPNRSVVGSDLGNKQIMSTGDQTQVQSNTQDKKSATSSAATDTVNTSASK